MPDVHIDRLQLTLPGNSIADPQRLVRLIAEKLGAAAIRDDRPSRHEAAKVEVTQDGADEDMLAARIVEDLVRQLNRTA